MKQKLQFLSCFLIAVLLCCCQKDDYDLDAKQFGPDNQPRIEYLKGGKALKAIQKLKGTMNRAGLQHTALNGNYAKVHNWTVEFDEILLVVDTLGNSNYTTA